MIQLSPVVKNIIIINAIMFFASFVFAEMGRDFDGIMSGYYFLSPIFRPWQLITHMFMHANLAHIFFNMYALVIFGPALESRFGAKKFLFYYLSCGFGAYLLHEGINHLEIQHAIKMITGAEYQEVLEHGLEVLKSNHMYRNQYMNTIMYGNFMGVVGASGAVFGILLAFGMLFSEVELRLLFIPFPIKAKWFVVIYGGIELLMALRNAPDDNVAHYAHLGGMLFGFIMIKYWKSKNMLY
ncbi:MAG: rhomboid family intramembrane serine protease [Flavobacteriales bacterium]